MHTTIRTYRQHQQHTGSSLVQNISQNRRTLEFGSNKDTLMPCVVGERETEGKETTNKQFVDKDKMMQCFVFAREIAFVGWTCSSLRIINKGLF